MYVYVDAWGIVKCFWDWMSEILKKLVPSYEKSFYLCQNATEFTVTQHDKNTGVDILYFSVWPRLRKKKVVCVEEIS